MPSFGIRRTANSRADFRLYDNENGFYLKRVTVSHRRPHLTIRPRDAALAPELLDLSRFFNADISKYAPRGDIDAAIQVRQAIRSKTGVDFDFRGVIALHRLQEELDGNRFPTSMSIPIHRRVRRMHFLHSSAYREFEGRRIGAYTLYASDGSQSEIPIIYGGNVRGERGDLRKLTDAEVAWEGEGVLAGPGTWVRMYTFTWVNPQPDVALARLEFTSTGTMCSPHLLAITVE